MAMVRFHSNRPTRFSLGIDRDHTNSREQHEATDKEHRNDVGSGPVFERSCNVTSREPGEIPSSIDQRNSRRCGSPGKELRWDRPKTRQSGEDRARRNGDHRDSSRCRTHKERNRDADGADRCGRGDVPCFYPTLSSVSRPKVQSNSRRKVGNSDDEPLLKQVEFCTVQRFKAVNDGGKKEGEGVQPIDKSEVNQGEGPNTAVTEHDTDAGVLRCGPGRRRGRSTPGHDHRPGHRGRRWR